MCGPLEEALGTSVDRCGPLCASLQTSADLSAHHSADLAADLCGPSTSRSLLKLMFCDKSHTKPLLFETRAHQHIDFERMSHAKTRFPHETRKHACLSEVSHKNTTFEPPGVLFCDCVVLWRRLWGPLWTVADLCAPLCRPLRTSRRTTLRTLLRTSAGLPHRARC